MKNLFRRLLTWVTAVLMIVVMLPSQVTTVEADTTSNESSNLSDFVKAASFTNTNIKANSDGSYTVDEGASYEIKLDFAEEDKDGGKQFADAMTYTLPSGFNVADGTSGYIDISIDVGTKVYTLKNKRLHQEEWVNFIAL